MATYEQIGFELVIREAVKARKKSKPEQRSREAIKFTHYPTKNQAFFQNYLQAFNTLHFNRQQADDYETFQRLIEEKAAWVFFEALKDIELTEKSIKKNWDHVVHAATTSALFSGLAAFAYFAPVAAAGTVAVLAGLIPAVIGITLALLVATLAMCAKAGGCSNPCDSKSFGELCMALVGLGVYIGMASYPYALASMPFIAMGSAGLAAVCMVVLVVAGISTAVSAFKTNKQFASALHDKLSTVCAAESADPYQREAPPPYNPQWSMPPAEIECDNSRLFAPM